MIKQVVGLKPHKQRKLDRGVTRQEDMPPCATCMRIIYGAAIQGYDGRWRCLKCNQAHIADVFRESGESAPLPSDDTSLSHTSAKFDAAHDAKRKAKAKAILDKYGVAAKR